MVRMLKAATCLGMVGCGAFLVFHARQSDYDAASRAALSSGTRADVAIVLTGASGRISQGLDLLAQGKTGHVFISGVGEGVRLEDLPDITAISQDQARCCVSLGYEARDTIGNAREVAQFMAGKASMEAFVVTSSDHMPRAFAELRAQLPALQPVIVTVPSSQGLGREISEFGKYVAALVRLKLHS